MLTIASSSHRLHPTFISTSTGPGPHHVGRSFFTSSSRCKICVTPSRKSILRWSDTDLQTRVGGAVSSTSCALEPDQIQSKSTSPSLPSQPYPSLFPTWRNPRWSQLHVSSTINNSSTNQSTSPSLSSSPSSSKKLLPLKLLCAFTIVTVFPALAVVYTKLNTFSRRLVTSAVQTSLDRPIHIGRVARFNPVIGIRLVDVVLPPSPQRPTAPVITAKHVDVTLSGFIRALAFRTPLSLDVKLNRANIRVSQLVVDGPKGLPIGQWDPGLPSKPSSSSNNSSTNSATSTTNMILFKDVSSSNLNNNINNSNNSNNKERIEQEQQTFNEKMEHRIQQFLRFVQPGTLSVTNSFVTLQPADFQDYGHGDEPVHFRNASATVTFPRLEYTTSTSNPIPLNLHGDFEAIVKGTPVEGGSIFMSCSANGDTLFDLEQEDVVVRMRVVGSGVQAPRVASFLSLPFRADAGKCAADIHLDFLYKSESLVPLMQGEAKLDDVALRFHPDPKTPEFHNISGTLKFVEKDMYMHEASGILGALPMSVVGHIHLEDGYHLDGYAHPVDVNAILDTFDVEKFVPVQGIVHGHAKLYGTLEEPMISGHAESTTTATTAAGTGAGTSTIQNKAKGSVEDEDENQNEISPVFDRLPLNSAQVDFKWDAVAGILHYPRIHADVSGGGTVSGSGSMFFDMTKHTEWDIRQEEHSDRNPKSQFWNGNATLKNTSSGLPDPPADPLEIDEAAPYRPYDSMKFTFTAENLVGGDLLHYFGGEYGSMAHMALGKVSAEAILAGHVKDTNCRVLWKTVTEPPQIGLMHENDNLEQNQIDNKSSNTKDKRRIFRPSPTPNPNSETQDKDTIVETSAKSNVRATSTQSENTSDTSTSSATSTTNSVKIDSKLGGGSFNGLVHLKLGDPPEARRVKVRTIVRDFDARRAGWGDSKLRPVLKHTPYLRTSVDTFFKGVMFQRPILLPGVKEMPRTPRMQLIGVDGAVVARGFKLNDIAFKKPMSGSFAFGTSDFAMSLKQVDARIETDEDHWDLTSSHGTFSGDSTSDVSVDKKMENERAEETESESVQMKEQEDGNIRPVDELTIQASVNGEGNIALHLGESEINMKSVIKKESGKHVVSLTSTKFELHSVLARHMMLSGADALKGTVDLNLNVDLSSRTGGGNILVQDVAFGPVQMSSIGSELVFLGDEIELRNALVKYRNSEYGFNGQYSLTPITSDDFESSVNIDVRHADFRDVSKLIRGLTSVMNTLLTQTSAPTSVDKNPPTEIDNTFSPVWLQKIMRCHEDDDEIRIFDRWEAPPNLSASEKAEWAMRVAEERKELERMGRLKRRRKKLRRRMSKKEVEKRKRQSSVAVEGAVSGQIRLNYGSKSRNTENVSEKNNMSSSNPLLQSIKDQLAKTSFSMNLDGENCRIGDLPIRNVRASGIFEDGVFNLGPVAFEGENDFGGEANARITCAGGVDGSVIVRHAPAALVQKYSRAPVQVSGDCSARLEVEGILSNPRVLGRVVWVNASLNGKPVRDARSDLACVNGRCVLNMDAKIGGRRHPREQQKSTDSLKWGKGIDEELKDLAARAVATNKGSNGNGEVGSNRNGARNRRRGRGENTGNNRMVNNNKRGLTEDGLQIEISAPVRFYLVNYLRNRAQSSSLPSVWAPHLEPVLGASFPSDDEWIVADINVKKYGLLLLNSIAPDLGWEGGDSDVRLRVSGSAQHPVIAGRVSVSDGRLSPAVLEESITGLKGEITIGEGGVMSLRSISGRCGGKWINAGGDLFLTNWHERQARNELSSDERDLDRLSSPSSNSNNSGQIKKKRRWPRSTLNRRKRRILTTRVTDAKNVLQRTSRGLYIEFGDICVDFSKILVSKMSGRLVVNGALAQPSIGGSLVLSDGVMFLGNVGSVSSSTSSLKNGNGNGKVTTQVQPIPGLKEISVTPEDYHRVKPSISSSSGAKFNGLKVTLGRNMRMVQSFVLNIQTAGDVTVNGNSSNPDLEGRIRLLRGSVNLLASRMRLARSESSYVTLVGRNEWQRQGLSGDPELLLRIVMEDDNMVVRIGECRMSSWLDGIQVRNKKRQLYAPHTYYNDFDEEFRARLDDEGIDGGRRIASVGSTGRFDMRRSVLNWFLRIFEIGGKIGKLEVAVFPAVLSMDNDLNNGLVNNYEQQAQDGNTKLKGDMAGGVKVDSGVLSVSAAKAVNGAAEGKLEIRFGRWVRIGIGADGKVLSTQVDMFGRLGAGKRKERNRNQTPYKQRQQPGRHFTSQDKDK